jgi:hypothetical protein
MKRLTIAAAIAAATCMISIPAVAALASSGSSSNHGPSHSQLVDDRSGPNRGSDDVTLSPSATPTTAEPGDDNGVEVEPGDDNGVHAEPGDDNGTEVEPGDDNGVHTEPGDDNGAHGGGHNGRH